jgi:hypothetical protein
LSIRRRRRRKTGAQRMLAQLKERAAANPEVLGFEEPRRATSAAWRRLPSLGVFSAERGRATNSDPEATVRVYRSAGVASPVQLGYAVHTSKDHQGCRAPRPRPSPMGGVIHLGGPSLGQPVLIFGRSVTVMMRPSPAR